MPHARMNCCRCSITQCSCCRPRLLRSLSQQGGTLYVPVQGGGRDACARSPPISGIWALRSASSRRCIALIYHPHLIVVPGGGVSPDGTRWISCRPGFFLLVRVLSRLFRWRMIRKTRL
ncbi:MAG: hypothetical protein EOR73_30265 [Mesorhizobium sp.]|nr:MAG: hypothetical protein EOR73_30265 [Mesorhizobium sp.]